MCKRGPYVRPGPWLAVLAELAGRGVPDGRIAAELSRRFAPARWSRWSVWYWRTAPLRDDPDQESEVRSPDPGGRYTTGNRVVTVADVRRWRERQYQVAAGWSHLLPGETRTREGRVYFAGGHELRPREVDILSLLRDEGSLTARQLAALLGLARRPARHGHDWLAGLCRRGLVAARPPRPLAYALA